MKPKVSIVIRVKNEAENLRLTLELINKQRTNFEYEIIIVDSDSKDGTIDVAKKYGCKVINVEDFSWGKGLNKGIENSKGDFCILLSAHCYPANDRWASTLVAPLLKWRNVAATYGRQIPIRGLNPFEEVELRMWFPPKHSSKFAFSNANACIRREIWNLFKFNEYLNSCEDTEWALRVKNAGYVLRYVPEAIVYHSHELNIQKIFRREYWRCREFVKIWTYPAKKMVNLINNLFSPAILPAIFGYTIIRYLLWVFQDLVFFPRENFRELYKIIFYEFIRAYAFLLGTYDGLIDLKKPSENLRFMYYDVNYPFPKKFKFIEKGNDSKNTRRYLKLT